MNFVGTTINLACQGMSPCMRARLTFIIAMYRIHNAHRASKNTTIVDMLIQDNISNIIVFMVPLAGLEPAHAGLSGRSFDEV